MRFEFLPVDLIADILSELDLESLITISTLSKRLRNIVSDPSLNPWRRPILRVLRSGNYESSLKNLSVRSTVPRQNWIEILSLASPSFLLYEATLPNLTSEEWEECFNRRFLPGWRRWRKDGTWKKTYLKLVLCQCMLIRSFEVLYKVIAPYFSSYRDLVHLGRSVDQVGTSLFYEFDSPYIFTDILS
ncbi:hypothetical protein C0989_003456 [Termitomyces sp. Mn162]|nr:hypothetical protein C0989_003456 [Termitomyces sp. Mn162]